MSLGDEFSRVGFIWDIDGVVVDSPHEEAWRVVATREPWSVDELSSEFYFTHVASRPRYEGGDNILRLKGVYDRLGVKGDMERRAILERFCTEKNELIRELIRKGEFKLFADAVIQLLRAKRAGILQAAASASKNVRDMLVRTSRDRILREVGDDSGVLREDDTLYSVFDVDVCGMDLGGKVEIQRFAAERLNELAGGRLRKFVVFEDAPSGVRAAKSLGYRAVGVLRIGKEEELRGAGADLVVTDLREVGVEELVRL